MARVRDRVKKDVKLIRLSVQVEGIVQGVGFRPFVYRLALKHGLKGWVMNNSLGVELEIEGREKEIEGFLLELQQEGPPLARIDRVKTKELSCIREADFIIRPSQALLPRAALITPDTSICPQCLEELFDPENRRYRYPFINCTNCGPRFTIIHDIPYDRHNTTMRVFAMCPNCEREYHDPADRRFNCQPNACWTCGPQLLLVDSFDNPIPSDDPIAGAICFLKAGKIVAIKGLGGFHLAVDATSDKAVSQLRQKKGREEKPFAIMAYDPVRVGEFCLLDEDALKELTSPQRPIVLLPKRPENRISPLVAPYNNCFGVMVPYTPIHYLLLRDNCLTLVMTSGNLSHEPLITDEQMALKKLGGIADAFLIHNRGIYNRADDSIMRVTKGHRQVIRRARGYVPKPIIFPGSGPPILALGGELKSTICIAKQGQAFLSQYIGDLENAETYEAFLETIQYFKGALGVNPQIIAHDLHPEYLSTKYALEQDGIRRIAVQHHDAHVASCLAEYGSEPRVIGVTLDGTGYGSDGHLWGGEFLVADGQDFKRRAHLAYLPLPGGQGAIKNPYRMAISYLYQVFGDEIWTLPLSIIKETDQRELEILLKIIKARINCPLTSSCGRLFDAIAALTGLRRKVTFEGQAAIDLEMAIPLGLEPSGGGYEYAVKSKPKGYEVDWHTIIVSVVEDLQKKVDISTISTRFHNTIANIILDLCQRLRHDEGLDTVVLSGGVFQNHYLLERAHQLLKQEYFKVLIPREVPLNDGGLSLGQAFIAQRLVQEEG